MRVPQGLKEVWEHRALPGRLQIQTEIALLRHSLSQLLRTNGGDVEYTSGVAW